MRSPRARARPGAMRSLSAFQMASPGWLSSQRGYAEARMNAPRRTRRWARPAKATGLVLALVFAGWLGLVLYPQPLFAFELRRANVVLHGRVPLASEGGPLLEEVVRRVARSPLYDPLRVHHVFLCDTPALFA